MDNKKISSLEELYELALSDIKGKPGSIVIYVDGIPKVSHSNDIIGNCLQEWLPAWFIDHGLDLKATAQTQKFPDFTADFGDKTYSMDIKCWNYNNTPAFDLANFDSFYRTTWSDPSKIFAKYLAISYKPTDHGFSIADIFLKSIWEITGPSRKYPIGLQVKQNNPYAIRPCNFTNAAIPTFKSPAEFIKAIYDTRKIFNEAPERYEYTPEEWLEKLMLEIATYSDL